VKSTNELNREKLERRLDYARYLLTETVEPFDRIAANCGWSSEKAFANSFQRQIGVTPAHYRNWHQQ
jgi:transcriptional regulator GlxA family with amidase domain